MWQAYSSRWKWDAGVSYVYPLSNGERITYVGLSLFRKLFRPHVTALWLTAISA